MRVRRAIGGARRRLGRSVGNLGSALGQRVSAATRDARMGAQLAVDNLREGLRESAVENARRSAERKSARQRATQPYSPKPSRPKQIPKQQTPPTPVTPKQQTPPTPVTPKQKSSVNVSSSRKSPTLSISSPLAKPPAGAKQAKGVRPYGRYGLGALAALGGGYAIHKGVQNIRKLMDSNNKMKKVSSAAMNNGMPKNAVQHLLKTASAKLIEQEQELAQLRQWYQEAQVLTKAASVADRLVATGQLDYSDRDDKAVELASDPDRLPIVEEAINMMHNPSAFSVASISDEYSDARTARTQLESYLLGH